MQLAPLSMFVIALAKHHGANAERERGLVGRLIELRFTRSRCNGATTQNRK
jgi:hypothetical protein